MSLDVYLSVDGEEVYWANITHNLIEMAEEAGIYKALWCPEELNATRAKDIIKPVKKGLKKLTKRPSYFEQFNASNGWGEYRNFVVFVAKYLEALKKHPEAKIRTRT